MSAGLHTEIHIVHQAVGTRVPAPFADDDGEGRMYLMVVRKGSKERPLTVHEVTDALRLWSPSLLCDWQLTHLHIEESVYPRCIKATCTFAPDVDLRWKLHAGYFERYDDDAAQIAAKLPNSWDWFIGRLRSPSTPTASSQSDRQSRGHENSEQMKKAFHDALDEIIDADAKAPDAIWSTADRFSVSSLARKYGLPRRTFERRVYDMCGGRSAAAVIQDIRLKLAFELLPKCATTKEVANRLGYSPSHFSKLYKARYGVSPSDFTK